MCKRDVFADSVCDRAVHSAKIGHFRARIGHGGRGRWCMTFKHAS